LRAEGLKRREGDLGELLGFVAKPSRVVPTRAIYYGIFFRDRDGKLQLATDNFHADRKDAEKSIQLYRAAKAEGTATEYFIGALSVPVSAKEQAHA
jgi:hypothetical protein